MNNKWPKKLPELSLEQQQIRKEFTIKWYEESPKFSIIAKFNHVWGIKGDVFPEECNTLEVGVGLGAHIEFEDLTKQKYYALELMPEMADKIKKRFPSVEVITGDIQSRLNFPDAFFDRVIAVHVLEHLPGLPAALNEIKRLLKPGGFCDFVVPCEGSPAYLLAREFSGKRCFKKHFKMSYDWFVKSEHINIYSEIVEEIEKAGFEIKWKKFFPIPIPLVWCNLAVGLKCYVKK